MREEKRAKESGWQGRERRATFSPHPDPSGPVLLARHAPMAAAGFVGQSLYPVLQKPLHPLGDKAPADPDGLGNMGNWHPIGQE